ncbi:hypothetical protein OH146_12320 [Salinibacterium sp. SYSU T00001]|uniref:hypothetical protein n=1 Tax=Homoserinimonas sedimenticola TaxID=2986805 RepID=UPI002236400A|nr:hypothetical protein [Salinibacterium sedimenticola]MCW4386559.1 hypothetical protein [Salinibacterium sedimenticola]
MTEQEHITTSPTMVVRGFDRLITTQRPAVLAHVRNVRRRHPDASPEEIIRILEKHYLSAVTAGGAGVGAAAVVPGVGTGVSLALTGVETGVFLEMSALFAQSVTEIHGIAVTDPDRARTVVMAMMLGTSGAELVRNLAAQATGRGVPRTAFWGDVIGRSVPQAFVGPIADRVKRAFIGRFARNTSAGAVGRLLPFGVGAVVGGTANHLLGRRIVAASRQAFGPAPAVFPPNLEQVNPPRPRPSVRLPKVSPLLIPLRRQLPAAPSSTAAEKPDAAAERSGEAS